MEVKKYRTGEEGEVEPIGRFSAKPPFAHFAAVIACLYFDRPGKAVK